MATSSKPSPPLPSLPTTLLFEGAQDPFSTPVPTPCHCTHSLIVTCPLKACGLAMPQRGDSPRGFQERA